MTELAAAEITHADVRESIAVARSHGEKFFNEIVWQIENEAWHVLGYASWDEMREAEYGDMGVVAPRADRPELVSRLRNKGLTQKQIATTLGVTDMTVSRDLRQSTNVDSPIVNARGQERPPTYQRRESQPEPEFVSATEALGVVLDPPDPAVEERRRQRKEEDEAAYWRDQAVGQWNEFLARSVEFLAYDGARCASDYDPAKYRVKPLTRELCEQAIDGIQLLMKEIGL